MKTILPAIIAISLAAGIALYVFPTRTKRQLAASPPPSAQVAEQDTTAPSPQLKHRGTIRQEAAAPHDVASPEARATNIALPQSLTTSSPSFQRTMQTLLSPQSTFEEKQGAWQQLKDSGKMDLALNELEQRTASNPNLAEYPATLGQGYLQKAATLKDIREQGILGMKADQSFDTALSLDPSNWEAGFWKAAAMSYWPPQLNKGQEVLERFADLIKVQETQPPQPQFAQTYVLLGEQYQKQGYADYAHQIWQRGSAMFPNDTRLLEKLTQPQPQQAATK